MENQEEITKKVEGQIRKWKAKYGAVHQVTVPVGDEEEEAIAYFRKPDLKTIGAAGKFAETDPIKAGEIIFSNCWLGGDERIKEDDEAKIAAIKAVGQLFKAKVAQVKKL
tara:strand:- start:5291 stop:5620 length:330 start_codon:yes stop_codon:yes gene_type:complete